MSEIDSVLNKLEAYHYPRFDELPEEPVFISDVVEIVRQTASAVPMRVLRKLFTTSMVSNYVKQGLVDPPVGKKYTRKHIAQVLYVAMLKLVFRVEEVAIFTHMLDWEHHCEEVHNAAAEAFEGCMAFGIERFRNEGFIEADPKVSIEASNLPHQLFRLASMAFSSKILALSLVMADSGEDDRFVE